MHTFILIISPATSLSTSHTYRSVPYNSTHLDFTACCGGATFLLGIEVFWEQGPNKSSVEEEKPRQTGIIMEEVEHKREKGRERETGVQTKEQTLGKTGVFLTRVTEVLPHHSAYCFGALETVQSLHTHML